MRQTHKVKFTKKEILLIKDSMDNFGPTSFASNEDRELFLSVGKKIDLRLHHFEASAQRLNELRERLGKK